MLSIWVVLSKLLSLLFMFILTVIIGATIVYFNSMPETDKNKPLIAWDVVMLICYLISTAVNVVFG